jgi:flagellar biosynthesis protein FlhG
MDGKMIRDQAETLRKSNTTMKVEKKIEKARAITRVISFTSGKGGVGKTNTVVNVAVALARAGRSVLILDADLGLANIDVMLGIRPTLTLHDVIEGRRTLQEIMIDGPEGISIIPAASGVESICSLTTEQRLQLMNAVEEVAWKFDYLLIDTAAGIGQDVLHFNSASSEIVCVVNGEPTSLTDAYALIKVLSRNYGEREISILANNISATDSDRLASHKMMDEEGLRAFRRLARAVERFLHIELKYLGCVPRDNAVSAAINSQRALLEAFPSSSAGLALAAVARKIDSEFVDLRVKGGMQFFFRQLLEMSASHGG